MTTFRTGSRQVLRTLCTTISTSRAVLAVILISSSATLAACACGTIHGESDGGTDAGGLDAGAQDISCQVPAEDCLHGLFFGVCGDGDVPLLACNRSNGRCRWFRGGCPVGWRASDCPIDQVCCHETPDGLWPFDPSTSFSPGPRLMITLDIAAMGWTVIDESAPAEIAVTVDPSIGPPTSDWADCTPDAPLQICRDRLIIERGARSTDLSLVLRFASQARHAEAVLLEIVPAGGSLQARMFVRDEDDAAPPSLPSRCRPFHMESTSGTLRLNTVDLSMPELVHGALEVDLDGGHTMAVEF